MNGRKYAAIFLPVLLALAACGREAADTAVLPGPSASAPSVWSAPSSASESSADANADEEAIRAAGATRDSAYKFGKADLVIAHFAANAVLMPPTAPTAASPAAIRRYIESDMAQLSAAGYTTIVPAKTVEAHVAGDLGYRSGRYSVTDRSGTVVDSGKWLEIWQKADGRWQIIRDIWNSDSLPLTGPPTPDEQGGTAG